MIHLIAWHRGPGQHAQGEVRRVDKEAGKVTIKHGPLTNLDMPAMTMVIRVKDPAMLDQMKAGDKIHFCGRQNRWRIYGDATRNRQITRMMRFPISVMKGPNLHPVGAGGVPSARA